MNLLSAFCLAAGSLTLFMSLLAIVAGCAVKEAVADGRSVVSNIVTSNQIIRVSEEERRVIWCVANQNNFLVCVQILVFMALFGFVIYYFDKVRLERDDVFNHADNNVIQGELHRPRLPLLLQAQCLRGLQRTRHCDAPGRPPCPGHLLLAQDRGHQEEEEEQ